ncbi:MAG: TIGR02266 family protein [Deltaproteobacteria bacterium]
MAEDVADEAEGADKRRHPRAELQLLVQYRFDSVGDFLAEYSSNISLGGIYVRTDRPREEGALIYLQFALKDGSRLIEGLGRVVRSNPPGEGLPEGIEPGMGVEFVNFDDESIELIERIVQERLERTRPA